MPVRLRPSAPLHWRGETKAFIDAAKRTEPHPVEMRMEDKERLCRLLERVWRSKSESTDRG